MGYANRLSVELFALAFQGVVTLLLLFVYYGLWRQRRRPYDLTWAAAWGVTRSGSACLRSACTARHWLFPQAATGSGKLLSCPRSGLLWGGPGRRSYVCGLAASPCGRHRCSVVIRNPGQWV
jgi:hypothetical protein